MNFVAHSKSEKMEQYFQSEIEKVKSNLANEHQKMLDSLFTEARTSEKILLEKRAELENLEQSLLSRQHQLDVRDGKVSLKEEEIRHSHTWLTKLPPMFFVAFSLMCVGGLDDFKKGEKGLFLTCAALSTLAFVVMVFY